MSALSEKAFKLLATDESVLQAKVPTNHIELSRFEMDCMDFGLVYGLVWAMARGEDPYETQHSVGERAQSASREVWVRWNGSLLNREEAEAA